MSPYLKATPQSVRADTDPYDEEPREPLPESANNLTPSPTPQPTGTSAAGTAPLINWEGAPTTTTTTTGGGMDSPESIWSNPAVAGMLKSQGVTYTSPIYTLLRPGPVQFRSNSPIPSLAFGRPKSTFDQYEAEYWEKAYQNPETKMWLGQRAVALGFAKYDPESPNYVSEEAFTNGGVAAMWKWAGQVVMSNPTLNLLTPEEWLDSAYLRVGGDAALEAQKEEAPNPITTQVSTSTYTMSKAQADAAADAIAMQVLGHMASDADFKKARSTMNGILKANPTVSTTTTDRTNPDAVTSSTHTKGGASPQDAAAAYEMKLRRGSEGMAFNVGKLMEEAMMSIDKGL